MKAKGDTCWQPELLQDCPDLYPIYITPQNCQTGVLLFLASWVHFSFPVYLEFFYYPWSEACMVPTWAPSHWSTPMEAQNRWKNQTRRIFWRNCPTWTLRKPGPWTALWSKSGDQGDGRWWAKSPPRSWTWKKKGTQKDQCEILNLEVPSFHLGFHPASTLGGQSVPRGPGMVWKAGCEKGAEFSQGSGHPKLPVGHAKPLERNIQVWQVYTPKSLT